jgi:hypothetical protein
LALERHRDGADLVLAGLQLDEKTSTFLMECRCSRLFTWSIRPPCRYESMGEWKMFCLLAKNRGAQERGIDSYKNSKNVSSASPASRTG